MEKTECFPIFTLTGTECGMLHLSGWKEWWDVQGVWAERSVTPEREFPWGSLGIPSERNNQPRFTVTQLKAKPPGILQTTSGGGVCTTPKRSGGRQPLATSGQTSLLRSSLPRCSFGEATCFLGCDSERPLLWALQLCASPFQLPPHPPAGFPGFPAITDSTHPWNSGCRGHVIQASFQRGGNDV